MRASSAVAGPGAGETFTETSPSETLGFGRPLCWPVTVIHARLSR